MRSYDELISLDSYLDRYYYLKEDGCVGRETFGYERYLNQILYTSYDWRVFRKKIILRDKGNDMAHYDYGIQGMVIVHHMNPVTIDDIRLQRKCVFDPDNVVCVSDITHKAIHYGTADLLMTEPIIRTPNDMCPWKK